MWSWVVYYCEKFHWPPIAARERKKQEEERRKKEETKREKAELRRRRGEERERQQVENARELPDGQGEDAGVYSYVTLCNILLVNSLIVHV